MTPEDRLSRISLPSSATVEEVLRCLNATGIGVVCLVDDDRRLRGVVTDGDIRRAMLAGATLTDPVAGFLRPDFVAGRVDAPRAANLALMSSRILQLPIVDGDGRLVDLISWKDLWHVPLVAPSLSGNELAYVEDCIATGWVSSQGSYITRFEEAVRAFCGATHALSTANCTLALQLAVQALNIGPGDEVLVPNFTFGASANAVLQRGARPVFVDIDPVTWTIDPAAAERAITPRTRAIMPVHIYGQPCDMDAIMDIAGRHGLRVIEDCAEALGASWKGRAVGTFGDVGCFSFFANKIITTGEGGMITCNSPELFDRLKVLRDHGMRPERRYWHVEAGTNCRMTNLQAAIGLAQMERVEQFLARRDELARHYDERLAEVPGLTIHRAVAGGHKVCWLYSLAVDADAFGMDRDTLLTRLKELGIESRPVFAPLHRQPAFLGGGDGPFPGAELIAARGLSLPTGNDMAAIEAVRVAEALGRLARRG